MSDILVFNGWGYKADIWDSFIEGGYDIYESQLDLKSYKLVYAWSLGVLKCIEQIDSFANDCRFHFYSPCLSFVAREGFEGNLIESVDLMINGLEKSPKTVLKLFHKKAKSKIPSIFLDIRNSGLRKGLEALKDFDFTGSPKLLNTKSVSLYAAKNDPIISLNQSIAFSEKHSLPLEVYDTFSHSFFLDRAHDK